MKRHKGIKGQPPMRFDLCLMRRSCNGTGVQPSLINSSLGQYLRRNVWQHPSSLLQGTLGHDTCPYYGLSVRLRTHDEKFTTRCSERRPGGRYRTFTPVGATPNLKRVALCGTVSATFLLA